MDSLRLVLLFVIIEVIKNDWMDISDGKKGDNY